MEVQNINEWEKLKKEFYGKDILSAFNGGYIDFSKKGMKDVRKGENLSYDDYLYIQKESCGYTRTYFEMAYYLGECYGFKGRIERKTHKNVVFKRIMVGGCYNDGIGFYGKEDHAWMSESGFEDYQPGDCLSFSAEIYRYLKTGHGRQIDFALEHPTFIKKIESYEVPTDEELIDQQINQLVCETCMFRDHCSLGNCIADSQERKQRFAILKNLQPGKFTEFTVLAAYELDGRIIERLNLKMPDKDEPNYEVLKKIFDLAERTPIY
jgi:hypothetical protein